MFLHLFVCFLKPSVLIYSLLLLWKCKTEQVFREFRKPWQTCCCSFSRLWFSKENLFSRPSHFYKGPIILKAFLKTTFLLIPTDRQASLKCRKCLLFYGTSKPCLQMNSLFVYIPFGGGCFAFLDVVLHVRVSDLGLYRFWYFHCQEISGIFASFL